MGRDGDERIRGEDRFAHGGAVEGDEDGVGVDKGARKGNLGRRDGAAGSDPLVPPEDSQVFVHGPGISQLVHHPHEAGGRQHVGVVGIEIKGRRNVSAGSQRIGDIGEDGGFEKVEVEDARRGHGEDYRVLARRHGRS